MAGDGKKFLFKFFFARTQLIWTHFALSFMYYTKALANSSSEVLPRGHHPPPLPELQRIYYFFWQITFLACIDVKVLQALLDVWGVEKKHTKQPNSSFYRRQVHHEIVQKRMK
jgi:hypothetical protein